MKCDVFNIYKWSSWSQWPIACSTSCLTGQRCRIRKCVDNKGNEVNLKNCGNLTDARNCQKCIAKGICPIDAQWGEWKYWSDCYVKNNFCGLGTRSRARFCDNPKPKYNGMYCIGNSTEIMNCTIECSPHLDSQSEINTLINQYFDDLSDNIILKYHGDALSLDCYTPAYIKAVISEKKLYVIWYYNGIPLRSLQEIIQTEIEALQKKVIERTGIAKPHFKAPVGHIQFSGSKLLIDSVTVNDSGLYSCMLNYERVDYLNTFFTVIIGNTVKYAHEFSDFMFDSNTEGLEKVQFLDSAEIRWYLNRHFMFSGLLVSIEKRFLNQYVNKSYQGYWTCYLFTDYRYDSKRWLVNSFELRIVEPYSLWYKLVENPIIKWLCFYLIFGIISIILIFCSSFIVLKLKIKRWLDADKKIAIIKEEIENNRMMLMIGRKKAEVRTLELLDQAGWIETEN